MGNRYGHKGVPAPWDAIKAMWVSGAKSTKEIAAIFGVQPGTIGTRANREDWYKLRDEALGKIVIDRRRAIKASAAAEVPNPYPGVPAHPKVLVCPPIVPLPGPGPGAFGPEVPARPLTDKEIVERAIEIAGSQKFRERVIAANEKALKVLEESPPQNIGEADRFAEALTKVERIGARTYGYDREIERPVINIGVLTDSSAEYELG